MTRLLLSLLFVLLTTPVWAFQVITGTYTGNATDNRDIVISPACQPVWVVVMKTDSNFDAVTRTAGHPTDNASGLTSNAGNMTNVIKSFNSNGFRVGTSSYANANTSLYAYTAVCDNGLNDIATGAITGAAGAGSDNLNITISPAFQPTFVILFTGTAGRFTLMRSSVFNTGDQCQIVLNGITSTTNDHIQAFNSDGFQVGSAVNSNSRLWYYVAMKGSGIASNSFTGNTTDNRDITVGFAPAMVMVKGASLTETGVVRMSSQVGDTSSCGSEATMNQANMIQGFGATTFQVGTHACANENGVTMNWFAITSVTPSPGIRARQPVRF